MPSLSAGAASRDLPVAVCLSAIETRALGGAVARVLEPGDVVLLVGELGTGKTTLVQGLVSSLGCSSPVTSPTFALCETYRSEPPVTHVDLWRLEHMREIIDLALDEVLEAGGVVVAEWGEAALPLFGDDALVVRLAYCGSVEAREISFETAGERWAARRSRLATQLKMLGGNGSRGAVATP